jgi:hypothetical protein
MVDLNTFLDAFPEFGDLDSNRVQIALDFAHRQISETVYGPDTDRAIMLQAAHALEMTRPAKEGQLPPIKSLELEGEGQVTFTEVKGGIEGFSTRYAWELSLIQQSLVVVGYRVI